MSDRICTNCGGATATGCWLCNPDAFSGANQYADPLDKSYWPKEAGRLAAENAYLTQRIAELEAESAGRLRELNRKVGECRQEWMRAEAAENVCEAAESALERVRELPVLLRVCADALEIASDWNVENVQVHPPEAWNLPAIDEDSAEGWCSTYALAERTRKVADELTAILAKR